MKILVESPEWQYKEIKGDKGISEEVMINASCAIRLGEPLEQEPRKGHWIDSSNGWMCSECNKDNTYDTNYCPNCGADMRGEE